MSGRFQCMCGQCWYGGAADWPAVERQLASDGFSEGEIERFRKSVGDRYEFHRPEGTGRPPMRGDKEAVR